MYDLLMETHGKFKTIVQTCKKKMYCLTDADILELKQININTINF